ncbi:hypothetical protein SAMD00019534_018530 [Acytostelium subglobosum LB1]|uniref:hypothetical protein n=1 Tax=Acytostelium subglobosum LB1 TaxID=1410327 RepID=UPI000644CED3|nr:hypothetical protein SAMD00019534_018530 [Acytostelium subglobosum LB1]GAM18678.1 hypothetical protein SAMD00019534_018530 [Acytostelium subglobosum LB1]|eukprot:XP_012757898.1 hypothetical protein SAMD00019534_018530 [Acytostelium subglobosum LB1]
MSKKNPFSFFTYVESSSPDQQQAAPVTPSTPHIVTSPSAQLPVFNTIPNSSSGGGGGGGGSGATKKKHGANFNPNLFDDDDDDDEEDDDDDEEEDDDDDDDHSSLRPRGTTTKISKPPTTVTAPSVAPSIPTTTTPLPTQTPKSSATKQQSQPIQQQPIQQQQPQTQTLPKVSSPSTSTQSSSKRLNQLFEDNVKLEETLIDDDRLTPISPAVANVNSPPTTSPLNLPNSLNLITPNSNASTTLPATLVPQIHNQAQLTKSIDATIGTTAAANNNVKMNEEMDNLRQQMEKLQQENNQYKTYVKQLKVKSNKLATEKEACELKLAATERAIEDFKIKEAKETAMMEEMIAGVEANLLETKKRAQKAEALVEQLKHENAMLKASGHSVDSQELRHRLQDAKEKGRMVSAMLHQAAADADVQLKGLMRGVETLQNISGLLTSIDRISSVP